jgi:hypothetical protein
MLLLADLADGHGNLSLSARIGSNSFFYQSFKQLSNRVGDSTHPEMGHFLPIFQIWLPKKELTASR